MYSSPFGFCRHNFLCVLALSFWVMLLSSGCRLQEGKIVSSDTPNRVGSHKAGSEVYETVAEAAFAGLIAELDRATSTIEDDVQFEVRGEKEKKRLKVCFAGVENSGGEDMGDLRENLNETIRGLISQSDRFEIVDERMMAALLRKSGMRLDDLLVSDNLTAFLENADKDTEWIDYILFAKVTTATTKDNSDSEVHYSLNMDLVDVHTGASIRHTEQMKKHYNRSVKAKFQDFFEW